MSKAAALELKPADESRVSFEIESVKPKAKLDDLKSMLVRRGVARYCGVMKLLRLLLSLRLRQLRKSWGY